MKSYFLTPLVLVICTIPTMAQVESYQPEAYESFEDGEMSGILVYGRDYIDPGDVSEPTKLSSQELKKQKYTDVMRVLKQVPGVQMREEDAFGLRPNIGMRGTNPDRSKKIVFMEDGVLVGPAPYSAPAAYYTPSMTTTQSMEVYKGFTAVPWGPNSIGGSLNYLTKAFTDKATANAQISYGSFDTLNSKVEGTYNFGNLQFAGIASHLQTQGFKELPDDRGTGFDKNDFLLKTQLNISKKQSVTLKLAYATELSNESYLGLTLNDIEANPYRRYSASELDNMKWTQERAQLTHQIQINNSSYIKTSGYFNHFDRTWKRIDRFADGTRLNNILSTPDIGNNANLYNILSGNADSTSPENNLILANNDREFINTGLQTNYFVTSEVNELQLGARFHYDEAIINHTYDTFSMQNGHLNFAGLPTSADELNDGNAKAITLLIQDKITLGNWTASLVGRYEDVELTRINNLTTERTSSRDQFFVPGLGISYSFTPAFALKASVNRAANVVNVTGVANREEATNYEAGFRYQSKISPLYAETTFFFNDYQNIAGLCTVSNGCTNENLGTQFDGGAAKIYGLETMFGYELRHRAWRFPMQVSASVIQAEFDNTFSSNSPEWGIGTVFDGDRLPYIPKIQYNINLGTQYKKFSSFLSLVYQTDMVDQSVQEGQIVIQPYGVVDFTAEYKAFKGGSIFAKVDNLFGRDYIVAARPFGLRPGKPQTFMAGLNYQF